MARLDRSRIEQMLCAAFELGMDGSGCVALMMGDREPPEEEAGEGGFGGGGVVRTARMLRCTVDDLDGGSVAGSSAGGTSHGTVTLEFETTMGSLEVEDGTAVDGDGVGSMYTAAGDAQRVVNCLSRRGFVEELAGNPVVGGHVINLGGARVIEIEPPADRARAFSIVITGSVERQIGAGVAF